MCVVTLSQHERRLVAALFGRSFLSPENFGLFFLGNRYIVRSTCHYAEIWSDVKRPDTLVGRGGKRLLAKAPRDPEKPTEAAPAAIAGPSRDITMLTLWMRRTPHHAFCQGVLLACFSSFLFALWSCLLIFCFRLFSLSFLPLSVVFSPLPPPSTTPRASWWKRYRDPNASANAQLAARSARCELSR